LVVLDDLWGEDFELIAALHRAWQAAPAPAPTFTVAGTNRH
jgi:hypothetical protein